MMLHKKGHSFDLALNGGYEELEFNYVKNLDLKSSIVIDIGSCIGYYALMLSKKVGNSGKVMAFEPEFKNFDLLQKNIEINKLQNIKAINSAVGNNNGKSFLSISSSPGQHCISKHANENVIKICRLDDFIEKKSYKKIAFVKIDVEGFELEILKGMGNILQNSEKITIQMEYAPQHLDDYNFNYQEFIDFLSSNNLKVRYWNLINNKLLTIKNPSWLIKKSVIEDFKNGIKYSRNLILTK